MVTQFSFFLLLISSMVSFKALGWGQIGHRAVGEIAENHLSKSAKLAVKAILKQESLAQVSTWPDEIKSDSDKRYLKFSSWHYVDLPEGTTYETSEKNPDGNVVLAIEELIKYLKDTSSQEDLAKRKKEKPLPEESVAEIVKDKKEVLKLLVHFVGDIHQPLHTGNGKDQGGNWCLVTWFNVPSNLHQVWDEKLVESQQLSYTELVKFIGKVSSKEIAKLQSSTVRDWAHESQSLREKVYPVTSSGLPYCKKTSSEKIPPDAQPSLSYKYIYEMKPIMYKRIKEAGIRLAGVLNAIYK